MPYILTENNIELLEIIYKYGGYTRLKHLQLIYTGISHSVIYRTMTKLVEMKYLNSKRLKTSSKIESITYQITFPTCKLFHNPNSYFRKKHQEEYIYRALIKSYFLCSIHNQLGHRILTNNDNKIEYYRAAGFNKDMFPKKYNKNDSFIHFEETILDFSENLGDSIINNDLEIYNDSTKQSIVIFFDEYYKQPNKQVIKLLNRYINMINNNQEFPINFLIVVDDKNRQDIYNKCIEKFINSHTTSEKISDKLLRYYRDILLKFKNDEEKEQINLSYDTGEFRKNLLYNISKHGVKNLDNYDKDIIYNVNVKGEKYILEKVQNIISVYENISDSFADIEEFFMKLFVLEFFKHINFGVEYKQKFSIKTYLIDEIIYQH